MKKLAVWRLINEAIESGRAVTLLCVAESSGSSPGRQGFLMAVAADGRMEGSVGGGMMEHKLVGRARAGLPAAELIKQVHDKAAAKNQSGMICSGEQTVLLYPVQEKDAEASRRIIRCLSDLQSGTVMLSPQGLAFSPNIPAFDFSFQRKAEGDWLYQERLGYRNHLHIIGGGHCSLALSNLMAGLDFCLHVYDDRKDLLTLEQNASAHQKLLVTDYGELAALIPSGPSHYVAIMTFGYRTDDAALRALLNKEFAYIGLLGSKAKIAKMFAAYRAEGFAENLLQRLHAPIGLAINSRTPEEIAVSIAAQIIGVKNGSSGGASVVPV